MRRKYLHRAEVWQNGVTSDGYGGNINNPTQLGSSWCNITTVPTNKMVDYGLDITKQGITIKTRYRDDLDYLQEGIFFKYKGYDWIPVRLYDLDLLNEEITIIAMQ